jgi:hypothetical protein
VHRQAIPEKPLLPPGVLMFEFPFWRYNPDLRHESEMFYVFESRSSHNARALDARIVTANDEIVCEPATTAGDRSPLIRNVCRKIETIERDLARIQPGWFHVGRKPDVPKDACYLGKSGHSHTWVAAEGREGLTEFSLTVLNLSALIKETQTLINPGSVKFSPGDRGG